MIEKTRIHRVMLRLDRQGPFTATDVTRESAANSATVRKVFERDGAALLLESVDGARDGRERPVRLTAKGRAQFAAEEAAFRAALAEITPEEPEPPEAELALEVALATIGTLASPDDPEGVRARLTLAEAELSPAVRAGVPRAVAVAAALNRAGLALAALGDHGDPAPLCAALLRDVGAWRSDDVADRIGHVAALLPGWRAVAAGHARTPDQAARLLELALADALSAPAEAASDLDAGVRLALHRRAAAGDLVLSGNDMLRQPDAADEMRQIKSQIRDLSAQVDAGQAFLLKALIDRAARPRDARDMARAW